MRTSPDEPVSDEFPPDAVEGRPPDRGVRKGRGAASNASGRFERERRNLVDDGWSSLAEEPAPRTSVQPDAARRIVTRNDSPDIGFDRSINPYRGCEHGCIYCYARPTHAYLGFSPGLDFETKLFAKHDAAALLEAELSAKRYVPEVIVLGTNTDAYQPIEKGLEITRGILQVLHRFRHPVALVTKSALVTRDVDILGEMAAEGLAHVTLSVTTLDRELCRLMEPRAATPGRRLGAIRTLAEAGVPVAVNVAPIIPGLTDHEIEAILEAAAEAGASEAGYTVLRLPLELKDLFREWLEEHRPDRAARVLSQVRAMRGGQLYRAEFGERMRGSGQEAELIAQRFRLACARLGLDRRRYVLDASRFRVPADAGAPQLALDL